MWPRYTYSLNRYLALSLFLHIVAIGGVFQYLHRADGQSVHTRAPLRITITAPPLPAESALDMDRKTPPLSRAHPRVMVADHTPSAPAPLIAPVTTGSPAFISGAIPPLPTREIVLQRPLASVSVPVPVQALPPSATRQPRAILTPPIPLTGLKHLPMPSPTLAQAPQSTVVTQATPLPPNTPRMRPEPVEMSPAAPTPPARTLPSVSSTPVSDLPPPQKLPPRPPEAVGSAASPSVSHVAIPTTPVPKASAPVRPPRGPAHRQQPVRITVPTPKVAQATSSSPRVVAPAARSVASSPPVLKPSMPATAAVQASIDAVQNAPLSPPASVTRQDPTKVSLAPISSPQANVIPLTPSTLTPHVPPTRQPSSVTMPRASATTVVPTPHPPPSSSTVVALPSSQTPQRQGGDSGPREVVDTPRLTQPTSPATRPARRRTRKPMRTARRQIPHESSPRFVYKPKPVYPLTARRRGWQGTVVLDIAMLADGTIGAVKIAESSGYPLLDAAAQKAVKKWRHIPVQHNGVSVARRANLPIRFRLD